jgi:hypothetical protein
MAEMYQFIKRKYLLQNATSQAAALAVKYKLAYKIQTPVIYTKESTKHSEHGESLKSRIQVN